jgi:hypothetical protein
MANTAEGQHCNVRLGYNRIPVGGRGDVRLSMPMLIASRDIAVNEEILCPYKSNDAKLLLSTSAVPAAASRRAKEPARLLSSPRSVQPGPHLSLPSALAADQLRAQMRREAQQATAAHVAAAAAARQQRFKTVNDINRVRHYIVESELTELGVAADCRSIIHSFLDPTMHLNSNERDAAVAAGREFVNDINRLRSGQVRAGLKRSAAVLYRSGEAGQPSMDERTIRRNG